jgi:hypothetical protein
VTTNRSEKAGTGKLSKVGQKSTNVAQEVEQQLRESDCSLGQPRSDARSVLGAHFVVFAQQLCSVGAAMTLGFPTAGQRKMPRQMIRKPAVSALRMTIEHSIQLN